MLANPKIHTQDDADVLVLILDLIRVLHGVEKAVLPLIAAGALIPITFQHSLTNYNQQ